jgi:malonyl-CoA O-methyltransferase
MRGTTNLRRFAVAAFGRRRLLPAQEAYALWADTYPPSPHNPVMHAEQAVMAPIIQSTSPERALDAGTGSGRYLPLLASTGARVVVGVDLSLPMLVSRARSSPSVPPDFEAGDFGDRTPARQAQNVARVCGDVRRLPFGDAAFDLVSSSLMVGDVADLGGWVSEAARVLAPGGHLVYSDFHPSWATRRWHRTFRTADGRSFEVAYFSHTLADHVTVLEGRSFDIRAVREPRLAVRDVPATPATPDLHHPLPGGHADDVPVAIVFHAVKRG